MKAKRVLVLLVICIAVALMAGCATSMKALEMDKGITKVYSFPLVSVRSAVVTALAEKGFGINDTGKEQDEVSVITVKAQKIISGVKKSVYVDVNCVLVPFDSSTTQVFWSARQKIEKTYYQYRRFLYIPLWRRGSTREVVEEGAIHDKEFYDGLFDAVGKHLVPLTLSEEKK